MDEEDRSLHMEERYRRIIVLPFPEPLVLRLPIGELTTEEAVKKDLLVPYPHGHDVAKAHHGWPSRKAAKKFRRLGYGDTAVKHAVKEVMALFRAVTSYQHASSPIGTTIDRTDADSPISSITSHGNGTGICKAAASVHRISPASRPNDNVGAAGAAATAADGSTAGSVPPDAGAGAGLKTYDIASDLDDRKPAAVETVPPVPVARRVANAESAPNFDSAPDSVIDLCCDSISIIDLCSSHSDLNDRKPAAAGAGAAFSSANGTNGNAAGDAIDLRSISDYSNVPIINDSKPATTAPKRSTKSSKRGTKLSPTAKKSKTKRRKAKRQNGKFSSMISEYRCHPVPHFKPFDARMNEKYEICERTPVENPKNAPFVTTFRDYFLQCIQKATEGKVNYHQSVCLYTLPSYYLKFRQCTFQMTMENFTDLGINIKDPVMDAIEAILQELEGKAKGGINFAMQLAKDGNF